MRSHIEKESFEYFGVADNEWIENITSAWLNDKSNSQCRYEDIIRYSSGESLPKETRILDMACGCGTFVFYGLLNCLDVWGIDPEDWKLEFNHHKCDAYGYPSDWKSRFIKGVGEALPFPDSHFDFVSSYQTLEHVQNVEQCISEMMRVLKPGGVIFLRLPDYSSTFEGHYRLPWLPLLPRSIAKIYLKLLGRPDKGLATLNYVTNGNIKRLLLSMNPNVERIIDQNKLKFITKLEERFLISKPLWQNILYLGWKLRVALYGLFRQESHIDLYVVKNP